MTFFVYYMRIFAVAFIFSIALSLWGCGYLYNPSRKETKMLRKGKITDSTSFVYDLPYPKGRSYWMIQGYFTNFTHKRRAALDFKMPVGSKVCAARGGVVVHVKKDGKKGGPNSESRPHANYIIIEHEDNSRAGYWHLKYDGALVNKGDTVKTGQVIGLSGNTGYTYFPHLHFIVWGFDSHKKFRQVATRFRTAYGARYLHAVKKYRNPR